VIDVTLDHRAAQRARPEMLDLELCGLCVQLPGLHPGEHLVLKLHEAARARILQRTDRNDRKARIHLDGRYGVARLATDKRLFEARVGNRFPGTYESRPELAACRAHFEIRQDRLTATDDAGDEDRNLSDPRPDFL